MINESRFFKVSLPPLLELSNELDWNGTGTKLQFDYSSEVEIKVTELLAPEKHAVLNIVVELYKGDFHVSTADVGYLVTLDYGNWKFLQVRHLEDIVCVGDELSATAPLNETTTWTFANFSYVAETELECYEEVATWREEMREVTHLKIEINFSSGVSEDFSSDEVGEDFSSFFNVTVRIIPPGLNATDIGE
ncbi:hypothetical protein ACHWQZ_G008962 [Mnemiopsis leidyi]